MDRKLSVIIKNSAFLREKSDYDDFLLPGKGSRETDRRCKIIFGSRGEMVKRIISWILHIPRQ